VGPILGGFIVNMIGFDMSTFLIVILFIVAGLFYSINYFVNVAVPSRDEPEKVFLINHTKRASSTSIY